MCLRAIQSSVIVVQDSKGEPEKVVIRSKDGHQVFYSLVEDDGDEIVRMLNKTEVSE